MEKLVFDKTSWHYRLATTYAGYRTYDERDICTYSKHVAGGLLAILIGLTLVWLVLFLFVQPLIGAAVSLYYGVNLLSADHEFSLGVMLAVALISCLVKGYLSIEKRILMRRNKPTGYTPPNFIQKAYISWKEKFCVQIEFIESEKD